MNHIIRDIGAAQHIGRYSDAIEVRPGLRWLYSSGTPGIRPSGEMPPGIEGQSLVPWENVLALLVQAGMTANDLVKVTTSLTNGSYIQPCVKARSAVLGDVRPAFMLQIVNQLVKPGILVEIEIVAAAK